MDWVLHADQEVWKAPMWVWSALTQRLYQIGLYENHDLAEHRNDTLERLATVKALVEERYKDEPEVVMRYREANRSMGEEFRQIGVGSLAWQVQELGISGDDNLLRFISRPKTRRCFKTISRLSDRSWQDNLGRQWHVRPKAKND
jgi:hypothetical protein